MELTPQGILRSASSFTAFHARRCLDRVRSDSTRIVNVAPGSGIGLGNMFSFWLWSHAGRRYGLDWWTVRTDAMLPWIRVFPDVDELLIDAAELSVLDRRVLVWAQEYDKFLPPALESFVTERLLSAPLLQAKLRPVGDEVLTINVRRGDYYSVPKFRALYGFDIVGFIRTAVDGARRQAPIGRIDVVSDDAIWCRNNLGFLAEAAPELRFQRPSDGPLENLAQLASSRRLILANSSFSYWGAYLSNGVYENNHSLIWAPDFHRRDLNNGLAFQLDPRWSVVHVPTGTARCNQ